MADNDHNIIKPVNGLQNITGLTPAKRREERKKRQDLPEQKDQQRELAEDELNESTKEDIGSEIIENAQDRHSIDYCA
jgi:hypothetical protein